MLKLVLQGYLWHFAHLQHVDLHVAENALFKSYGIICLPPHSTVPDELSMNRSDSGGLFLRQSLVTAPAR